MPRLALLAVGLLAYASLALGFARTLGFLAAAPLPGIPDAGDPDDPMPALAVDLALLGGFALLHAGTTRPALRSVVERLVPEPIERSTRVLLGSLAWIGVMTLWQPLPGEAWHVTSAPGRTGLLVAFSLGVGLFLYASTLQGHLALTGLRPVLDVLRRRARRDGDFAIPTLHRFVRHPLWLTWLIVVWTTPRMSTDHLLLAVFFTLYADVATRLEERDLVRAFGSRYRRYQRETPRLVPLRLPRAPRTGRTICTSAPGRTGPALYTSAE